MISGLVVFCLIITIGGLAFYFNHKRKNKLEQPDEGKPQRVELADINTDRRQAVDKQLNKLNFGEEIDD